ncbi:MAG TPA: hypothetical protein PLT00_00560 [Verrucomicrobiota bacterium]|nr:hypothetical protein [Verrucomicrobiota bacterium]HQB15186.1 hypothetical protein [Verrucomicrobiota bacterium]
MSESSPRQPGYQSAAYLDWVALALAVLAFWGLGTIWEAAGETSFWCAWMIGVPLFIAFSVSRRALVAPADGRVTETIFLWGRVRLGTRRTPLARFSAIVYRFRKRDTDEWWVGLRHRVGRTIWLRAFGPGWAGGPPRSAEEFAWRLHCDTDIPIRETKRRKWV